jgi:hypothetical protein
LRDIEIILCENLRIAAWAGVIFSPFDLRLNEIRQRRRRFFSKSVGHRLSRGALELVALCCRGAFLSPLVVRICDPKLFHAGAGRCLGPSGQRQDVGEHAATPRPRPFESRLDRDRIVGRERGGSFPQNGIADQSSKLIRRSSLDLITQLIRYPLSDSAAGTALFFSFLEKTFARSNPENRILAAEWRSGFSERIRASQRSDRRVFSNHVNKTKISASGVERAGGRLPRQIGPVVTSHQPTVPQVTTARP